MLTILAVNITIVLIIHQTESSMAALFLLLYSNKQPAFSFSYYSVAISIAIILFNIDHFFSHTTINNNVLTRYKIILVIIQK